MKLKTFIYLFSLFILFSCKKSSGDFTIKGKITDNTFNKGLNDATIELYKVQVATNNKIFVASQTLGSDGSYSFTFPREQIEKYIIQVKKNLYFPIESMVYYSELELGKETIRDYSTGAKSWVELRFLNNNPNTNDHFRYIKQEGYSGCATCCPTTEQNYYGALDTSLYCINQGNTPYSIYYWVIGTSTQGLEKVTTTPFDTSLIFIQY